MAPSEVGVGETDATPIRQLAADGREVTWQTVHNSEQRGWREIIKVGAGARSKERHPQVMSAKL